MVGAKPYVPWEPVPARVRRRHNLEVILAGVAEDPVINWQPQLWLVLDRARAGLGEAWTSYFPAQN
jgi:hypothetical protein